MHLEDDCFLLGWRNLVGANCFHEVQYVSILDLRLHGSSPKSLVVIRDWRRYILTPGEAWCFSS